VLGSGFGAVADRLADPVAIPYAAIPGWPETTAEGHAGKLLFGELGGRKVALLAGRVHLYEGYGPRRVVFGVRVLARMGGRLLVLTNAAGGIHPAFDRGRLVLLSDHINLQGANPLTGPNDDALGPRFPNMTDAYSPRCRRIAQRVAGTLGIDLAEGVYAAVPGPSYETPAEIQFLKTIGADLVGMSTAQEVIAARHMGLEVLAISCVANRAAGLSSERVSHQKVLDAIGQATETLGRLLEALLPEL